MLSVARSESGDWADYCVTVLFRLRATLTRPGLSDEDGRYGHHQPAAAQQDLEQSGSKHLCSGGFLNRHWNNLSPPEIGALVHKDHDFLGSLKTNQRCEYFCT